MSTAGTFGRLAKTSATLPALLVRLVTQAVVFIYGCFRSAGSRQANRGRMGIAPALIGYYTSILYAVVMAGSLSSSPLIQRYGSVRVGQASALFAASAAASPSAVDGSGIR